jgi:hypothetical protein
MDAGAVTADLYVSACRTNLGQRTSATRSSGFLGPGTPYMGVEMVFVPFMRQAGLCIAAAWVNVLNCRQSCPLCRDPCTSAIILSMGRSRLDGALPRAL